MFPPLHAYPAYKLSNTEILGDVSKHWEVRRLRNIVYPDNVEMGYEISFIRCLSLVPMTRPLTSAMSILGCIEGKSLED